MDVILGHEHLTFIDAFFGYNQIWMALENKERLAFISNHGHFYYKVILFGLKNIEATYQRMVNKIFKDQIG